MSSSRSTSPTPPSSNNRSRPEGGSTLSNDALYAPLSTYAACSSTSHAAATTTTKKNTHSLSLQTTSSLRESSLITFLTSMSQNLKTSHPHEYQLYRGMGGSIARFGMGDNDRASSSMRSVLEGKLLNRSLVLVGGGVHGHGSGSRRSALGKRSDEGAKDGMGVVGLGSAAALSGKRERKRVGGNGIFGSISNKKRKRMLHQTRERHSSRGNKFSELKIPNGDGGGKNEVDASIQKEQSRNETLFDCKETQDDAKPTDKVDTVIQTIHEMWVNYIHQLLHPIKAAARNNVATSTDAQALLTLEDRRQISLLLATAEHVGMPATIVECPSRLHLTHSRCIVVNETKETWKIAMIMRKQKCASKGNGEPTTAKNELVDNSNHRKKEATKQPSHLWKIVMVPKHGTTLEVDLPWDGSSFSNADSMVSRRKRKKTYVTVRLDS